MAAAHVRRGVHGQAALATVKHSIVKPYSAAVRPPPAARNTLPRPMRQKNPETYDEKLAQLNELREAATHANPEAEEKQHDRGKMTARERVLKLLDEDSFQELDTFVATARRTSTCRRTRRGRRSGNRARHDQWAPGVRVQQDFTVFGGSLGEVMAEKMVKSINLAAKSGARDRHQRSAARRSQEGVVSLGAYGDVFVRNVQCSGVIPQISLIMGPCTDGAVYSPP